MKNKKILVLIICILLLVAIISVSLIIINNNSNETNQTPDDVQMDKYVYNATYKLEEEKNVASYITVNNCINNYLKYIADNNIDGIENVLTSNYKNKNSIDRNNILSIIDKVNENCQYCADKVYTYDSDFFFNTYIVIGKIIDNVNNKAIERNFLLNIDGRKITFEIEPLENKSIENIDVQEISNINKEINLNDYNQADLAIGIDDKEVLNFYYKQFILKMVNDTQSAYDLLDKDYKEKRFGDYTNFQEYINFNKQDLESSFIMKYKIEEFDDYKEYLCVDNYGNYYIFKETTPMEYTVLLDQYTINDKIFTDEYNKKEDNIKAQMNLNKFEQMLNRQDFTSAYNVLNKDFKAKYFETEDKFKQYVLENWFKYNKFDYEEVSENKIKTSITNRLNTGEESKTKRFRVDIEKNEFYISFDI